MNYERDISIDQDALDVEWLDQPKLMFRYAQHAADMQRDYDQAKEQLDVVRAELDKKVREAPENYDIAKLTETVVSNTIITQKEYKQASTNVVNAKHDLDMARAAVKAMDGKKDALENLVRLHGQQYFAGPSVPRDLNKEWEAKQKQKSANQTVGKLIRKK